MSKKGTNLSHCKTIEIRQITKPAVPMWVFIANENGDWIWCGTKGNYIPVVSLAVIDLYDSTGYLYQNTTAAMILHQGDVIIAATLEKYVGTYYTCMNDPKSNK